MIKEVKEIPSRKTGQRDQIKADIRCALDKRIEKFEFVGDYNFKYLAQYAREEAVSVFQEAIKEQRTEVMTKVRKELNFPGARVKNAYDYKRQLFNITSVKGRVFMSIDYNFLDNIAETMYNDGIEETKMLRERRKAHEQRSKNSNT